MTCSTREAAISRYRWVATIKSGGMIVIAAGMAWAVYSEWPTIRSGLGDLGHTRWHWVELAVASESVSMWAFVLLQRRLLDALGVRPSISWLRAKAYWANAIAYAVPVAGSGLATGYSYRQFRRGGADPRAASLALTFAGVVSAVAFAAVIVLAAIASGSLAPAAAVGSAVGCAISVGVLAAVLRALRSPQHRDHLERLAGRLVRWLQRIVHRPKGDPASIVRGIFEPFSGVHLSLATLSTSFMWAFLNWITDALCLVLAIMAAGGGVPWDRVLLIWSAGIGAGTFSPTPGGIGVVEVTMISAFVASGLRAPEAVAAVVIYRLVNAKILTTVVLFVRLSIRDRFERSVAG